MKVIDYVYKNHFSSPNWIGEGYNQFKDKQEILDWIPIANCPLSFSDVDIPYYQPIKKGNDCAVANKSEKQQRKLCRECWNREYLTQDDEYETYLRLKEKFESNE
jgi:hypothetical protein